MTRTLLRLWRIDRREVVEAIERLRGEHDDHRCASFCERRGCDKIAAEAVVVDIGSYDELFACPVSPNGDEWQEQAIDRSR